MARKVIWSDKAWLDLEQAADYIARDSQYYAAGFVQKVKIASSTLTEMPYRARQVPELENAAVRELLVKGYRLIFEIDKDNIYVLGLIHQSRDADIVQDLGGSD